MRLSSVYWVGLVLYFYSFCSGTLSPQAWSSPPAPDKLYPGKSLAQTYALEAEDPFHRRGLDLDKKYKLFSDLEKQNQDNPNWLWKGKFWEWLDEEGEGRNMPHVKYLTHEELKHYQVHYQNGNIRSDFLLHFPGQETHHTFIFIMDREGNFYIADKIRGDTSQNAFHHTSFLAGQPIASAGEIRMNPSTGQIFSLTNGTGHYKTQIREITFAAHELKKHGIQIDQVKCEGWGFDDSSFQLGFSEYTPVSCQEWLNSFKNFASEEDLKVFEGFSAE